MTDTHRDSFAGAMREAQRPTGPLVGSIVAIVLFLVGCLLLTALMGVVAMLQAYVFPWMIPGR